MECDRLPKVLLESYRVYRMRRDSHAHRDMCMDEAGCHHLSELHKLIS